MTAAIRAALSVFDNATLEALANRGLLRRAAKDIESGKVVVEEEHDTHIIVRADGQSVEIDTRGPRAASCSCPASGICRHRLAAVLLLRQPPSPTAAAASGMADTALMPDPARELAALDADAVVRWAGKATIRAAQELLAETTPLIEVEGGGLRIEVAPFRPVVRILAGQGLDGIVSKESSAARTKVLHAAAVLAVRRAHGLSDDDMLAEAHATAPSTQMDKEFLITVQQALLDAVPVVLSHAPEVLEERLFALSTTSRGDDLPALSRRLRHLSGSIRAKRIRDFTVEPEALLAAMGATFALAEALAQAETPESLARLKGLVRQSYAPAGTLNLKGLAARAWKTRSGAHGVTGYFFSEERGSTLTVTLTHGTEASFNSVSAFGGDVLWQAESLRRLIGAQLALRGARVSESGRLSLSRESTGLRSDWRPDVKKLATWPIAFAGWKHLEEFLRAAYAITLAGTTPGPMVVALLPSRCAAVSFDVIGQAFVWPLADIDGRWIELRSRCRSASEPACREPIEMLSHWVQVDIVFAEVAAQGTAFELQPLAIYGTAAADEPARYQLLDPLLAGTQADNIPDETSELVPRRQAMPLPAQIVGQVSDAVLALAEIGVRHQSEKTTHAFRELAARSENLGLETLATCCRTLADGDLKDSAAAVLRLAHVCDRLRGLTRGLPFLS